MISNTPFAANIVQLKSTLQVVLAIYISVDYECWGNFITHLTREHRGGNFTFSSS